MKKIITMLCFCMLLTSCTPSDDISQTTVATTTETTVTTITTNTEDDNVIETTEETSEVTTIETEANGLVANASAPKLIPLSSLTDEEINCLDSSCKDFGMGRQVDENNRPTGGLMIQADTIEYNGYVVLDSEDEIYLTFDQGYENGYTTQILDTLKEKGVPAVFFLTGDYAKRNKELVQRMIDEGHVLGNHGLKHRSLPTLNIECAENEIMELHNYVLETYNYEMTYFRPPCGQYSEKSLAITERLGYKTLLWSFAYADWDVNNQPDIETAFNRISSASHGEKFAFFIVFLPQMLKF